MRDVFVPETSFAERENVEKALNDLKTAMNRKEKTVIELAAIATFLHNIYNGIENILKQIIKAKAMSMPSSETWHKDLLNLSVSIGIITEELASELYTYLAFRHFFVHGYGFKLEEAHLRSLADDISRIWSQFITAANTYCASNLI